jgi:hypothetical protein
MINQLCNTSVISIQAFLFSICENNPKLINDSNFIPFVSINSFVKSQEDIDRAKTRIKKKKREDDDDDDLLQMETPVDSVSVKCEGIVQDGNLLNGSSPLIPMQTVTGDKVKGKRGPKPKLSKALNEMQLVKEEKDASQLKKQKKTKKTVNGQETTVVGNDKHSRKQTTNQKIRNKSQNLQPRITYPYRIPNTFYADNLIQSDHNHYSNFDLEYSRHTMRHLPWLPVKTTVDATTEVILTCLQQYRKSYNPGDEIVVMKNWCQERANEVYRHNHEIIAANKLILTNDRNDTTVIHENSNNMKPINLLPESLSVQYIESSSTQQESHWELIFSFENNEKCYIKIKPRRVSFLGVYPVPGTLRWQATINHIQGHEIDTFVIGYFDAEVEAADIQLRTYQLLKQSLESCSEWNLSLLMLVLERFRQDFHHKYPESRSRSRYRGVKAEADGTWTTTVMYQVSNCRN